MKRGFSLIELSIVLVVLGLLVGGVLSGQSLIHAAQLRAVTAEYQRYYTAMQSFQDKYLAIPGDFSGATHFWGLEYTSGSMGCSTNSGAAVTGASSGTCDGDNSNTLTWHNASISSELFQFWRQLALAGLIEGTYTGITGPAGFCASLPGTNMPLSKYPNGTWGISANQVGGGLVSWTPPSSYNSFIFGSITSGSTYCYANFPLLPPEDAWNIDSKLDDGKPGTGAVRGENDANCVTTPSNTATTYKLSGGVGCFVEFTGAFD